METGGTRLYVLTGFLGSGKTTLLHRLIMNLKGKKIGVLQNVFGKDAMDGGILGNDDIQMTEINKGSISSSFLDMTFVEALGQMSDKGFDYLFIESSGLGDPANIREILDASRLVSKKEYDFSGVICLVDALNFLEQLKDTETVDRQLKHCHMAVITKADLVDEHRMGEIRKRIREINPVCLIETSIKGDFPLDFLKADLMELSWHEEETSTVTDDRPETVYIEFSRKIQTNELMNFLNDIKNHCYRIKGYVNLVETGWNRVDVVGLSTDLEETDEGHDISQLVMVSKTGASLMRTLETAWKQNTDIDMTIRN